MLKSLFKDTAIYGLSSIVGRFLNYLLVPLYTAKIAAASGGYGVISEVYSYVALLMVLLTFGMETTFFRFINKVLPKGKYCYHTYGSLFKSRRVEKEMTPPVDYIFEGKKYLIPNDADSYLRRIYGDYTQLPPMAQQKPHHNNDL